MKQQQQPLPTKDIIWMYEISLDHKNIDYLVHFQAETQKTYKDKCEFSLFKAFSARCQPSCSLASFQH